MTHEIPVVGRMFYYNKTFYSIYNGSLKRVEGAFVNRLNKNHERVWITPSTIKPRTLRVYQPTAVRYEGHTHSMPEMDILNIVHNRYVVASNNEVVTCVVWLEDMSCISQYKGRRRYGTIAALKTLDSETYDGRETE